MMPSRTRQIILRSALSCLFLGLFMAMPLPALAQDNEPPYWASIRADVVNMRVGPSVNYRIAWVYNRPQLPLKVVRKKDGWRLVQDADGTQGWVVARFLSRDRTAIVTGDQPAAMHENPDPGTRLNWRLQPGVVGRLGACQSGWCRLDVQGRRGWVEESRLWGAGTP